MEREIKNTIKEEDKFKFGSGVSGGFGKFVQASIKIETESVDSQEEVNRTASKYARDTTEKTAAKLTERVREQQTRTILREFEEKNSHGFDNTAGTEHVIGLYQWVNRVYEAQVYNYGIRMFFDIMVPEPAAFYLQVVAQHDAGDEPEKFTSSPDSITAENYGELVALYQATAVEPPPAETVIVSKTIKVEMEQPDGIKATLIEHGAIAIPADYEATEARFRFSWHRLHFPNITPEPVPQLVAQFGQHQLLLDPAMRGSDPFQINAFFDKVAVDGETGELPYSMHFYAMNPIALVIEVVCTRSARGYAAWKQRTYEAILAGLPAAGRDLSQPPRRARSQAGRCHRGQRSAREPRARAERAQAQRGLHVDRPALCEVQRHPRERHTEAADRLRRGDGRGRLRTLLRTGVRVGVHGVRVPAVLLGPAKHLGRPAERSTASTRSMPPSCRQAMRESGCRCGPTSSAACSTSSTPARSGTAASSRRSPTGITPAISTKSPRDGGASLTRKSPSANPSISGCPRRWSASNRRPHCRPGYATTTATGSRQTSDGAAGPGFLSEERSSDDARWLPPPRRDCRIEPLVDACAAYDSMEKALLNAGESIWLAHWSLDTDFATQSATARDAGVHDWTSLLTDAVVRGAEVRILLNDFDPIVEYGWHLEAWQSYRHLMRKADEAAAADTEFDRRRFQVIVSLHEAQLDFPALSVAAHWNLGDGRQGAERLGTRQRHRVGAAGVRAAAAAVAARRLRS